MSTENINLNVGSSGLSYAIDKKLDQDLNTNVELNRSQWNTIFNLIKSDQVQENVSKFSEKDTDIGNGKHFIVQKNENYQIKQNIWQQILKIASTSIKAASKKKNTETNNDNGTIKEETPANKEQEKADVKQLLNDSGIECTDEMLEAVLNKKHIIQDYNNRQNQTLSPEILNMRLVNFAKGWKFMIFEANTLKDTTSVYNSDCAEAKSLPELQEKYKQFGKEFIEVHDQNNDGKIDAHELYFRELLTYYTNIGIDPISTKKKAIENTEKMKDYNLDNLPSNDNPISQTIEYEMFTDILLKTGVLDNNKDTTISLNEAAAYLMSMAQLDDTSNKITAQENTRTQLAIATQDMDLQEIMDTFDFSEDMAKNIISYREKFNNNLTAAQKFIDTGKFE